jgi:hypothetical protein
VDIDTLSYSIGVDGGNQSNVKPSPMDFFFNKENDYDVGHDNDQIDWKETIR